MAHVTWTKLIGPNLDALVNVFQASAQAKVRRVIFASSNHVMGGYKDLTEPFLLTTDLPPKPGTRYVVDGEERDSTPYGSGKLFRYLGPHLVNDHIHLHVKIHAERKS